MSTLLFTSLCCGPVVVTGCMQHLDSGSHLASDPPNLFSTEPRFFVCTHLVLHPKLDAFDRPVAVSIHRSRPADTTPGVVTTETCSLESLPALCSHSRD